MDDGIKASEEFVNRLKLSMLDEMDVFEFSRWITMTEDCENPREADLVATLEYLNDWQEEIVLKILANLYPHSEKK